MYSNSPWWNVTVLPFSIQSRCDGLPTLLLPAYLLFSYPLTYSSLTRLPTLLLPAIGADYELSTEGAVSRQN